MSAKQQSSEKYSYQDDSLADRVLKKRQSDEFAKFFFPYLQPGMRVLDCGCGPGTITIGFSEIVAPGEVIGIDQDIKQSEAVQAQAKAEGLQNLRFENGDIYALSFPDNSFDAVFANAIFAHLKDPIRALREVRRVLKPTGVLGVRDVSLDRALYAPLDPVMDRYFELQVGLVRHNGGNSGIGIELPSLISQAGFSQPKISAALEVFSGEKLELFGYWGENFWSSNMGKAMIELGWVDETEQAQISQHIVEFSRMPEAFMALPWVEVVAKNEGKES